MKKPLPLIGLAVIAAWAVVAIFAPLIAPDNPLGQKFAILAGPSGSHWFGTDELGRDVFSRVLFGARITLPLAVILVLAAMIIGAIIGAVAGYFGGWVDAVIARTMDVFLAFPLLLFALALANVIPYSAFGLSGNTLKIAVMVFVIGFFAWPYLGRIIRGQTLSLREREFVDAARSLGARGPYILFRELLPNLVAPILVYATLLVPANILFEAALDYLGVGLYVPTPTWGQMLSIAVTNQYWQIDPWYMLMPGLAIFITVMAFNLFGDGLRDALDPKTR
jgi:ABC-type dipeptide/oligopeptide/nickel transport system permease subunit